MVQIERPSEREPKTMRFSKENLGKSFDNVITKAKGSKNWKTNPKQMFKLQFSRLSQ